jgi:large subunit ribosomal protein L10
MQLANLESREVLLAKLAGAMKGSLAKAARVFDALRIKLESVSEETTNSAVSEVPAPAANTDVAPETVEAPAEAAVETPTDVAEAPVAEATEVTTEATPETEEKE